MPTSNPAPTPPPQSLDDALAALTPEERALWSAAMARGAIAVLRAMAREREEVRPDQKHSARVMDTRAPATSI